MTMMTSNRWLVVWLVLAGLALPAAAQDWEGIRFEVTPGKGAGPLRLGQPISQEAYGLLGRPTQHAPPSESPDSGSSVWGTVSGFEVVRGVHVKLNDGAAKDHVYSVYLTRVRAATDRGVYLGGPAETARKAYPEGRELEGRKSGRYSAGWQVPGLVFYFHQAEDGRERIAEMAVVPLR